MIAGQLEVVMLANMARLQSDMGKTKSMVGNAMSSVERSVNMAKRALGALGIGLSVAIFARFVKGNLDAQDQLSKLSQKLGISVEGLAGLQHAASLSGLSFEGLQKAIKTVSTQMFDASFGLMEAKRNFAALGISIKDSTGNLKGAEAIMVEVADRFAGMADGTTKAALAVKLFGRAGLDMIPMLNMGSAALAKMVEEGKALNPVTAESARQAELLNDSLEVMGKSFSAIGTRVLNDVLPVVSELAKLFAEEALQGDIKKTAEAAKELDNSFKILPETFKVLTIIGGNVSFVLQGIGRDLGGMAAQLAALGRGDFKGFSAIRKALIEDGKKARAELDAWEQRIMALGTGGGASPVARRGGAAPVAVDETAAKALLKAAKEAAQREQEVRDAMHKVREDDDNRELGQIAIQNERKAKMVQEGQQAFLAAIDWEQAQLIAAGEAEIAIAKAVAEAKKTEQEKALAQTHTFLGALSGLMNTESKKQFKIGKMAAAAETAINTYAAAMGAYKALASIPFVGPALGAAAAAAIAITGAAQIQKINSMEIGGQLGASGTFPASPTTGQPVGTPGGDVGRQRPGGTTTIVNLHGHTYTRAQVRDLLEIQNENSVDGSRTVVVER
jgi:hypothetical protein